MSEWLDKKHLCIPPSTENRDYDLNSIWQCDCGQKLVYWDSPAVRMAGREPHWRYVLDWEWVDDHFITTAEREAFEQAQRERFWASWPEPKSRWQQFVARIRGEQK